MSKTSLLWIIAALLMLVIAMAFDAHEAREKIASLEKDNSSLKIEAEQVAFNQQVDKMLDEKPLPKVDEQAAFNANMDNLLGFEPRKSNTVKEVAEEWDK